MDQNGPPILPSDFLLRSASERTFADIDPSPEPRRKDPAERPSVAVYYRGEEEVREGFLIALRAMELAGAEQHSNPSRPPVTGAKP
jgi:hypothetical protein